MGDGGDSRYLELSDTGTSASYSAQISCIPDFYSVDADPVATSNGTLRVFADWLEYDFNPNVTLQPGDPNAAGGDGSWVLANNWNTDIPSTLQSSTPYQVMCWFSLNWRTSAGT